MSSSQLPNDQSASTSPSTASPLAARLLDLEWQQRPGVIIKELRTYGCGIGSEYVYCYTYPTYIEMAHLKGEQRFRIKVGKADGDPIGRIYQQVGGSKTAISEFPHVLLIFQTLASRHLEKWLHKRLERAIDAGGSEWFLSSPDELIETYSEYLSRASGGVDATSAEEREDAVTHDRQVRKKTAGTAIRRETEMLLSSDAQVVHTMWRNMHDPITIEDLRQRVANQLGVSVDEVPAKFDHQIAIELGNTGRRPRFQLDSLQRLVLVPGAKMPQPRAANIGAGMGGELTISYARMGPATRAEDIIVCLKPWWPRAGNVPTERMQQGHRIQAVMNGMTPVTVGEIVGKTGLSLERVLGHVNFEINNRGRARIVPPTEIAHTDPRL